MQNTNNNYIPNTSSIPNILFDYWMNRLSPAQFKVLMCVARKTYGWHKHNDLISIKQIETMTGLHRSGIIKNIDSLIEIGLINKIKSKTPDGDDAPNRYEINVYCVEGGSLQNRLGVVDTVDQGVVYSVDPQKKDYTKENIQNSSTCADPPQNRVNAAEAAEMKSVHVKKDFTDDIKQLAESVIEAIVAVKPDFAKPKSMTPLITDLDLMIRIDKRTPERIMDVLRWALADDFWRSHMLKPNVARYLREKGRFDTLEEKVKSKFKDPKKVDRRTKNIDGTPVDAPHLKDLF